MRSTTVTSALVLAAVYALAAPTAAQQLAAAKPATPPPAKSRIAAPPAVSPSPSKGITPYDAALLAAHRSLVAGMAGAAYDEAIAGYRSTIALDPARPEGHLYLAAGLYLKKDNAGAEEAAVSAVARAREGGKASINTLGKALFLLATVREVAGKTAEAKTTWGEYAELAKANPDQPMPPGAGDAPPMVVKMFYGSAIERQTKIDNYAKLTADYAKVREKVIKRQKELGVAPTK